MKKYIVILFFMSCFAATFANNDLEGKWRGMVIGHVDNRDYVIKAIITEKKNDNFDIKLNVYSDDYSGEFLLHTVLENEQKLAIKKMEKIEEFPYPYLHIEDCFTGYFKIKKMPDNSLEMDLFRNPVYHKIEEFTNIDGDGNFVAGFDCFTSVLLRSSAKDTVLQTLEKKIESNILTKKVRNDESLKRKVVSDKKCTINNDTITLQIWDNNKQDGDIVSLKLNNEWILLNFPLKKEKHTITIPLKKPENQLMLFAENLGSIPPNTAAISINDNSTVKTFILNSDMKSSESIKIFYKDK